MRTLYNVTINYVKTPKIEMYAYLGTSKLYHHNSIDNLLFSYDLQEKSNLYSIFWINKTLLRQRHQI